MRLNQIARKIDVSTETIVDFFSKLGIEVKNSPNTKLTLAELDMLIKSMPEAKKMKLAKKDFFPEEQDKSTKNSSNSLPLQKKEKPKEKTAVATTRELNIDVSVPPKIEVLGRVVLANKPKVTKQPPVPTTLVPPRTLKPTAPTAPSDPPIFKSISSSIQTKPIKTIASVKVYEKREKEKDKDQGKDKHTPRKRIVHYHHDKKEVKSPKKSFNKDKKSPKFFSKSYKKTGENKKFSYKNKKYTKNKIENIDIPIKIAEFVSTKDLALLLGVSVDKIIETCTHLGIQVSQNQRLDASTISIVAESLEKQIEIVWVAQEKKEEVATESVPRAPIVVVMGHVDHGKTSLLDYLRKTKLVEKEHGGITQHIGAYQIEVEGKLMTFLDTPGHKAFTAMRARGAQVADVAIIIIAADDGVMPQTEEAIKHAQLGGLPIVFAFNKIDKPGVNVENIKQKLSMMNILVEDWGGKFQSENISAQTGEGIDNLLEKVLLEAELRDLTANLEQPATGLIIESSLMRGKGYVSTIIPKHGTLKVGDILLAGSFFGKIKALLTTQGQQVKECLPSMPVQVLGLNGAPQAGEVFRVVKNEQEARSLSSDHEFIFKDQALRAQHGSALQRMQQEFIEGNEISYFNVLIKGDTDGSVEALADILGSLHTEEYTAVRVIYRGVGPICESDVLLADNADAFVIGFHTKIDTKAQKLLEKNRVKVVVCNIIYEAIEAVENALNPANKEKLERIFLGRADVVKVFEIPRIGTIAGCVVQKGLIKKGTKIDVLRGEEKVYTGPIRQLKREKEIIKESKKGTECGISMVDFNDVKVGDTIECYEEKPFK